MMDDLDAELAALEAELEGELTEEAKEPVAKAEKKSKPTEQAKPVQKSEPVKTATVAEASVETIDEPIVATSLIATPETEHVEPSVTAIPATVSVEAKAPGKTGSTIKTFVSPQELKQDLAYNGNTLSNAFQEQASLFAHYSVQKSKAAHQEARYKQELEIWDARIDKEIRDEAADEGKKITEAAIAKQILLDARYIAARKRHNEARLIAELCKDACEAFRQRRDMLIQSGADAREELKGELRMQGNGRAENAKAAALTAMQS